MPDAPRRFKTLEELTPDEHFQRLNARHGGIEPKFETDAYKEARIRALKDAGLEPDRHEGGSKPLEEMTPEDHNRRRYGG